MSDCEVMESVCERVKDMQLTADVGCPDEFLYCHEEMPADMMLLPLVGGQGGLVLPDDLLAHASAFTCSEWASMCALALQAVLDDAARNDVAEADDWQYVDDAPELHMQDSFEGFL